MPIREFLIKFTSSEISEYMALDQLKNKDYVIG